MDNLTCYTNENQLLVVATVEYVRYDTKICNTHMVDITIESEAWSVRSFVQFKWQIGT